MHRSIDPPAQSSSEIKRVPLQMVTQAVLWFTFAFSDLAAIYKHVINHFHIHCLPIYFRQYIVGIFNSTKNVNLSSNLKRNSIGCFVLPQSCQTAVAKKVQKRYTTRFHQELQKDSSYSKIECFFLTTFMASIPRSGFWQELMAGYFCVKKQSIRILSRLHSEKNILDKNL